MIALCGYMKNIYKIEFLIKIIKYSISYLVIKILRMDFDHCVSFEYDDCTGDFGGDQELFWDVTYRNNKKIKIVTTVKEGVADLGYLEYLVSKGGRFVDMKVDKAEVEEQLKESLEVYAGMSKERVIEELIQYYTKVDKKEIEKNYDKYLKKYLKREENVAELFDDTVPNLINFLYLPYVVKHEYH